jgi:adenosylhomocysteine nucleosidase
MIGIIAAMESEAALLKSQMTKKRPLQAWKSANRPGFEFIEGALEGQDVVLLQCGIGKVNAAVGAALLIERYKPAAVINTGTAGGIDPSLHIGDVVISSGLLHFDVDVTGFGYVPGQVPQMPPVFEANTDLATLGERAVDELKDEGILPKDFNHRRGSIGSGDLFMDKPERIKAVKETFPAVLAVEMEGAAIAQTAYLAGVPFLIIRAISDVAGSDSPQTHDQFVEIASKHSAEIVKRIVQRHKGA